MQGLTKLLSGLPGVQILRPIRKLFGSAPKPVCKCATMDKSAVAKMGAMASASVCALVGGVVLAQYIFTVKKKTGRKTKIIEMVSTL